MDFGYWFGVLLLILGFGFVIFWHELGHFLAAKWAGVRVEQFAIGFGTAMCSWRKGLGFTWGSSGKQYEEIRRSETTGINPTDPTAIGETEYRLNWLPLGGYVKMLGQDDLNPNAQSDDPRSYNRQPISKRMVIVSAGVIMNVILAAFGFFVLFLYGFNAPPSIVGAIQPGSPAQRAGLQVGDRIVTLDGKFQHDFNKIFLNVALLPEDQAVPIQIERPQPDGTTQSQNLSIHPVRPDGDSTRGMLALGIMPSVELRGLDPKKLKDIEKYDAEVDPPSLKQIEPGDEIVAIAGVPVKDPHKDYYLLDRAMQQSDGKPVRISVKKPDGSIKQEDIQPVFRELFGDHVPLEFGGMSPRVMVSMLVSESLVKGKVKPGDVITSINVARDPFENPPIDKLRELINNAGETNTEVQLSVLRDGAPIQIDKLVPALKTESKKLGIGIGLTYDEMHPVIAAIHAGSAAERAQVPRNSTILAINDQPVSDWHDVQKLLRGAHASEPVKLALGVTGAAKPQVVMLQLSQAELDKITSYRYRHELALRERVDPRQTRNPIEAARWGAGETRDLIVQFYLTIKRMIQRSVPASNLMGPVGIARAGTAFATRGTDWLIWFLSMISANLAVVNFLPIPIVDGGLFVFLIVEKLQGRPLSARTQSIAQFVGLALILSVFVFVTYQDFMR